MSETASSRYSAIAGAIVSHGGRFWDAQIRELGPPATGKDGGYRGSIIGPVAGRGHAMAPKQMEEVGGAMIRCFSCLENEVRFLMSKRRRVTLTSCGLAIVFTCFYLFVANRFGMWLPVIVKDGMDGSRTRFPGSRIGSLTQGERLVFASGLFGTLMIMVGLSRRAH